MRGLDSYLRMYVFRIIYWICLYMKQPKQNPLLSATSMLNFEITHALIELVHAPQLFKEWVR